jgi:hypothetical protein
VSTASARRANARRLKAARREFTPDWVIAPAVVLQAWLDEKGLDPDVFVVACAPSGYARKRCLTRVRAVLAREPMTVEDAAIIAKGTFTTARLWLALEHNYRAGLAAGLTERTPT